MRRAEPTSITLFQYVASMLLVCMIAGYILLRLTSVFMERAAPELPFRLYSVIARESARLR